MPEFCGFIIVISSSSFGFLSSTLGLILSTGDNLMNYLLPNLLCCTSVETLGLFLRSFTRSALSLSSSFVFFFFLSESIEDILWMELSIDALILEPLDSVARRLRRNGDGDTLKFNGFLLIKLSLIAP